MKKTLLYIAAATVLFAGCAKETDKNKDIASESKIYTISASVDNPETRTVASRFQDGDSYKYSFSWETGEKIAVVPTNVNSMVLFDLADANLGTFTHEAMGDEPEYTGFGLAVTPANALTSLAPSPTNYEIYFSGSYLQGSSNAIMVAGEPTTGSDGNQKFQFKHIAALVKVTYNNVPAGTLGMVFVADHNIKGTFQFTSSTGIVASNDAFATVEDDTPMEAFVMLPEMPDAPVATMDFFVPIPVGEYQTFQVYLMDEGGETVPNSEASWTASSPFTVNVADVVACPEVEIQEPDYSGDWIMVGFYGDDAYACPAYTTGDKNIKGVEVTVNNGIVSSTESSIKMTFTKVISGDYEGMYTIQDAEGKYLCATSSSANNIKAEIVSDPSTMSASHYWTVVPEEGGKYSIVASKDTENRNVLQFNPNNGTPLFSCYSEESNQRSNVLLYDWDNAVITLTCVKPLIAFDGTNVTITTETAGAKIYYTLDGSEPSSSSAEYTVPFSISTTKTVKAIAIADGYEDSEVAEKECVVGDDTWTLVTSTDDLVAGDLYVIANNSNNAVAGPLNSDYLSSVSGVVFTSDKGTITTLPNNALQFTLGGSTGAWTFTCSAGQLYSNGAKKVNFSSNGNGTWKISFSGNNAVIENGKSDNGKLQYNASSPRFTTYSSSMTVIQLYRKPAAEDTRDDAELSFSPTSATAVVGEPFTAPQLIKNPSDITVTWASSDQNVAYINQTSGEIQIKKAGTATITASFAGNAQYKPTSASYELTVNPSYDITLQGVTDGKVYVGAANNAKVTFKVSSGYAWNTNVSFENGINNSFTISPSQNAAGNEVVVTITSAVENETEAARQLGSVTISNGGSSQTIQIWQKAPVGDWAFNNTSNINLSSTGGSNANNCTVIIDGERVSGVKAGTGEKVGAVKLTIPEGTTVLHLHLGGWNNETTKVTVKRANSNIATLELKSDPGVSGNSPYTLTETDASKFYHTISLSAVTTDVELTLTATAGKRFIIWGVNAE